HPEPGDQPGVLRDVVGRDADRGAVLREDLTRDRVLEPGAVRRGAGVAGRAAVGLDEDPATHRPDSDVRTRIREHSSQRTTSSEGALAITDRSEGLIVIWQPLHRRARSAAAATPCLDTRSLS